jgi:hypothetical protein
MTFYGIFLTMLICLLVSILPVIYSQLIDPALIKAVSEMSGAFLVPQKGLEKTVIVTAANMGYLNHFMNFYCFLKKQNMKLLVVSMDDKIHAHLNKLNADSKRNNISEVDMMSYLMPSTGVYLPSSNSPSTSSKTTFDKGYNPYETIQPTAAAFRSQQFILMTYRKIAVVQAILALGYDVVFSDTDNVIVNNPFPQLLWKNIDYAHSLNDPCEKK